MARSSLVPQLPSTAWKILAGDACSALGTGLVLPFLVVYLRDVRDIPIGTATLAFAGMALVGLLLGPVGGSLIDRFGPRPMLISSLIVCAVASFLTAEITQPWHAFAVTALLGVGFSVLWPATHSLLSGLVSEEQRSGIFAVHYMTLNAGIGIGGIIGGFLANVSEPSTFEWLYRFDALSWLIFAVVLFVVRDIPTARVAPEDEVAGTYREVLRDKTFVKLCVILTIFVIVGYAQLESGFSAFATGDGGISTRVLGFAFAANTSVIVISQLFVLRFLTGRRRTRAMMAICVIWMIAWGMTALAGSIGAYGLRAAMFIASCGVFALGECLVSPSGPAITNDLAPDRLRGRYNAAYSLTFSVGHIIGPPLAGLFLSNGEGQGLFLTLVAILGATLFLVRDLERIIPVHANIGRPDEDPTKEQAEAGFATA